MRVVNLVQQTWTFAKRVRQNASNNFNCNHLRCEKPHSLGGRFIITILSKFTERIILVCVTQFCDHGRAFREEKMKLLMFVTFGPGTEGIAAKSRKCREFNIHKALAAFTLVETMAAMSVLGMDSRQRRSTHEVQFNREHQPECHGSLHRGHESNRPDPIGHSVQPAEDQSGWHSPRFRQNCSSALRPRRMCRFIKTRTQGPSSPEPLPRR